MLKNTWILRRSEDDYAKEHPDLGGYDEDMRFGRIRFGVNRRITAIFGRYFKENGALELLTEWIFFEFSMTRNMVQWTNRWMLHWGDC
jgi:hypothetical protein